MEHKVAFVTGGGSGICKGITRRFMAHGAEAAIVSRKLDRLEASAKELADATGRGCLALAADVWGRRVLEKWQLERLGVPVLGDIGHEHLALDLHQRRRHHQKLTGQLDVDLLDHL